MKVSVVGLGYVGLTVSACLSDLGHMIIGLDIDDDKIKKIQKGNFIINEENINEILLKNISENKISWTVDYDFALGNSDIVFICVDTPIDTNGMLYMDNIYNVAKRIGRFLNENNKYLTIVIRSTVNPGTNQKVKNLLTKGISDIHNQKRFDIVSNPEFLREGSAVRDFYNPPYTVIGTKSDKSIQIMKNLYSKIAGEMVVVEPNIAELIKIVNNSFHALKVSFANEIGRLCKEMKIDSKKLMDLFVKDKKLNISSYYLKPGFAYGGSCLSKDLESLNTIINKFKVTAPILSNVSLSNEIHINYIADRIIKEQKDKVGIYGLAFKAGTADLRSSASLDLAEILIKKNIDLTIFDSNLNKESLLCDSSISEIHNIIYNQLEPSLENFAKSLDILVLINIDDNIEDLLFYLKKSVKIFDYTNSEVLAEYKSYNSF